MDDSERRPRTFSRGRLAGDMDGVLGGTVGCSWWCVGEGAGGGPFGASARGAKEEVAAVLRNEFLKVAPELWRAAVKAACRCLRFVM